MGVLFYGSNELTNIPFVAMMDSADGKYDLLIPNHSATRQFNLRILGHFPNIETITDKEKYHWHRY